MLRRREMKGNLWFVKMLQRNVVKRMAITAMNLMMTDSVPSTRNPSPKRLNGSCLAARLRIIAKL